MRERLISSKTVGEEHVGKEKYSYLLLSSVNNPESTNNKKNYNFCILSKILKMGAISPSETLVTT
jgi:hypothetical protein